MSRLLRGVYSAVRNQLNSSVRSAPQSVCHEHDDEEGASGRTSVHEELELHSGQGSIPENETKRADLSCACDSLEQHNPSSMIYKPYVTKRFTSLHCSRIPQYDDNALHIPITLQSGSFGLDYESNGPSDGCEGTSGETLGKARWEFGFDTGGKDADGQEKTQQHGQGCFKNFADTIGQGHTPLESLGWGVAVALGIHLSTAWDLDKHVRWARYSHRAVAMPMQNEASKAKRQTPNPNHTEELFVENDSQDKNSKEDITSFTDPGHDSPELQKAAADWEELSMRYTSSVCERLARRYSKHGHYATAAQLWEQASELGSTRASYNLGLCYHLGRGVEKDITKAAKFYQEAGSKGHVRAQYNLTVLSIQGQVPSGNQDTIQGQNRVMLDENWSKVVSEILSKSKSLNDPGAASSKLNHPSVPGIQISETKLNTQSGKLGGLSRSHSSPSNLYKLASDPKSLHELQPKNFTDKEQESFAVDKHHSWRNLSSSNFFNLDGMDLEKMKSAGSTEPSIPIDSAHNASLVLCT